MHQVSLYIPAYNVAEHLQRCVQSTLAQTHPLDEILIVDDGSKDNTVEIASRLESEHKPVRLIRNDGNCGVTATRNTGINQARNELVASLDVEMSKRLMAAGYEMVCDPAAIVRHYRRDSVRSIFDTQWRWFSGATKLQHKWARALEHSTNGSGN